MRPSMSSLNAADEEKAAFFSLYNATRRRKGGDVAKAVYTSFLIFILYMCTEQYALAYRSIRSYHTVSSFA